MQGSMVSSQIAFSTLGLCVLCERPCYVHVRNQGFKNPFVPQIAISILMLLCTWFPTDFMFPGCIWCIKTLEIEVFDAKIPFCRIQDCHNSPWRVGISRSLVELSLSSPWRVDSEFDSMLCVVDSFCHPVRAVSGPFLQSFSKL